MIGEILAHLVVEVVTCLFVEASGIFQSHTWAGIVVMFWSHQGPFMGLLWLSRETASSLANKGRNKLAVYGASCLQSIVLVACSLCC